MKLRKHTLITILGVILIAWGCSNTINPEEVSSVFIKRITNTSLLFEDGRTLSLNYSSDQSRFLLVRHAEKKVGNTSNPGLTPKGARRAKHLAEILAGTKVDKIYSTIYQRTIGTAQPVVESQGAALHSYTPNNLDSLANVFIAEGRGLTTLIVGHSNTTPELTRLLSGRDDIPDMSEVDYDNLYYIIRSSSGETQCFPLRFAPPILESVQ